MRLQADLLPHVRSAVERDMELLGHDGKRRMVTLGVVLAGALTSGERRRLAATLSVRGDDETAALIESELWPVRLLAAVSALKRDQQERLTAALCHPETLQVVLDWISAAPSPTGRAMPPESGSPQGQPARPATPRSPKGRPGRGRSGR